MEKISIPMEELVPILQLQLEQNGNALLPISGTSMMPMLRDGKDSVLLCPADRPLKKGDIPLYRRNGGRYVLHRIVGIMKNGDFLCCGDNQWQKETVRPQQVLAVVCNYYRGGKERSLSRLSYRLYVPIWAALRPLRRLYLSALHLLCAIKAKATGQK